MHSPVQQLERAHFKWDFYTALKQKPDGTQRPAVDGYTSACCDLDLWPFGHKIWAAHLWAQVQMWSKLGEMIIDFWDMVFTRFSGRTNSRTHSQTDRREYRMPPAPFFNDGEGVNAILAEYQSWRHEQIIYTGLKSQLTSVYVYSYSDGYLRLNWYCTRSLRGSAFTADERTVALWIFLLTVWSTVWCGRLN